MEAREKKVVSKAKNRQQKAAKFKQFIGNKSEGQGFADKRKKKIQYEYKKMLHKEQKAAAAKSRATESSAGNTSHAGPSPSKAQKHFRHPPRDQVALKGMNAFSKVADQRQKQMELKQQKKQEAEERRKVQTEARQAYQQKKKDNFKKICKRTHKGQPVMKNQIEYLLQKIERQVNQT